MGETLNQAWWERMARHNLEKGSINTALWFINMRNRFGWSNNPSIRSDTEEDVGYATIVDLSVRKTDSIYR